MIVAIGSIEFLRQQPEKVRQFDAQLNRVRFLAAPADSSSRTAYRSEETQVLQGPGGSVHGERANFTGLVLGCIDADFCK